MDTFLKSKIGEQLQVLEFSLGIGQKCITEIEERLKTKYETRSKEGKREFLENEAIYLFLKNFWQQYEFLLKKIEQEDELENFQFYIPLARILFEIYGEFLYFLNQDSRIQLGLFSANYLLYLSDFYRFVAMGNEEIKTEYQRLRGIWDEILSDEGISYSESIDLHSYKAVGDLGFRFPGYEQIFQKPYFSEQSVDTLKLWKKDTPENFYNKYYRSHSNYTHPSFTNQMSGATKNEVFWMIQFLYIIGQLMTELCSKKVFGRKFNKEYQKLTENIKAVYPKLQEVWNPRKN